MSHYFGVLVPILTMIDRRLPNRVGRWTLPTVIEAPVEKAGQDQSLETMSIYGTGLPRRYATRLIVSILFEIVLMLFLIEGIFLSEKFGGILETAILAKMSGWQIFLMLLYTAPEVFNLALPAAMVIAIYRVVLRLRENRELLVMAGAGVGVKPLLILLMAIAVPAQVLSLLMSGYINPHSQFLQRDIIFQMTYETLRSGAAFGEFHFPDEYTAFIQPPSTSIEPRLFLHQVLNPDTDRLVIAKHWRLAEEQDGWFKLQLQDFTSHDFFSANGINSLLKQPPSARSNIQMLTMRIGDFQQEVSINHLVYFAPRGTSSSERTLTELISQGDTIDAIRCIARSLLCLFVPLIALLGVSLTNGASWIAVPPLIVAAVMSLDIATISIARSFAQVDVMFTGVGLGIAALAILALLDRQLVAHQNGLLKPAIDET